MYSAPRTLFTFQDVVHYGRGVHAVQGGGLFTCFQTEFYQCGHATELCIGVVQFMHDVDDTLAIQIGVFVTTSRGLVLDENISEEIQEFFEREWEHLDFYVFLSVKPLDLIKKVSPLFWDNAILRILIESAGVHVRGTYRLELISMIRLSGIPVSRRHCTMRFIRLSLPQRRILVQPYHISILK